jgi:NAD(P)-dependent dehydrogenase (short-subunit alcohol dehydrogenase family)
MEETFRTNVSAPLFLSLSFLPLMKNINNNYSLIVNMSSIFGSISLNQKLVKINDNFVSGGGRYSYRTSKVALNMVTRSLSVDLEHLNIGAIAIQPGWVRTAMGGPKGLLSAEECVCGIFNVIEHYNVEKHNGQFLDLNGIVFPW